MNNAEQIKLYEFILAHYSLSELRELCTYLGVEYEDLDGGNRRTRTDALVKWVARRKRADDLHALLSQQREEPYLETFGREPRLAIVAPTTAPESAATRDPRQIFISHATADADFAQRLAAELRRDGYRIWIAPDSIRKGEQWVRAIGRGLETSGVMVLLASPAAAASPWVEMETNVAIELERAGEMRLIPVQLQRGRYPVMWRAYQWVMSGDDLAAALAGVRTCLVETSRGDVSDTPVTPPRGEETPRKGTPQRGVSTRVHEKTGIELVRIPAGPYLYGSADSDTMARDNEKPQRTIELPEYWIGRTPVTNAQFARFADATGYRTTAEKEGESYAWTVGKWEKVKGADWQHPSGPSSSISGKDAHPVVQVSWHDAQAFCDWAGLQLPSEQEWEKAARGDKDGRIWPWGDEWVDGRCNTSEAGIGDTTPVGRYSPQSDSPYGLQDCAGNVWEWTGSWYDEKRAGRVLRGGSWFYAQRNARVSVRNNHWPDFAFSIIGFRVSAPVVPGS